MATTNNSQVFIDGNEVLQNATYNVEIKQSVGVHHSFSIVFPISSTEGFSSNLMDDSINYIGKKVSIYYEGYLRPGKLEFVGIIDDISLNKTHYGNGDIRISGKSPDTLMSNRVDCRSFAEGTKLSDVLQTVLGEYSHQILKYKDNGKLTVNLPYTVQYNESDYDFINRIANHYGHWLYYNGTELCFGLTEPDEINAVYGVEISKFGLKASLRDQAFSVNQHDWVNNKGYQAFSASSQPNGKHPYLDVAKQESDYLYASEGYYNLVHGQAEYGGQEGVNQVSKTMTLGNAASMIMARGLSELPQLRIGDTIKIEGLNFNDNKQKDAYGSFSIIELVHGFSSTGEYTNSFRGLPKGTDYVSNRAIFDFPRADNQRAKVVANADPNGLGRIRVRFPWQRSGGEMSPWIKMATPYAGANKGFYFIPEIGEEVLIGFEDGNAERPFMLSAGFNKTAASSFADGNNNVKAIKTRSGHFIKFIDATSGSSSGGGQGATSGSNKSTLGDPNPNPGPGPNPNPNPNPDPDPGPNPDPNPNPNPDPGPNPDPNPDPDNPPTLEGTILTFPDGTEIDLSELMNNTDEQNIVDFSINPETGLITLELENGGSEIVDIGEYLNQANTEMQDQIISLGDQLGEMQEKMDESSVTQTDEGIIIQDSNGNSITINTAENTITVSALGDINIDSGSNVSISAKDEICLTGTVVCISASDKIAMDAGAEVTSTAGSKTTISSGAISEISAPNTNIKADAKLSMDGSIVNVNGSGTTNVKGGTINLN